MEKKLYKTHENVPKCIGEPAVAYRTTTPKAHIAAEWNPNVPFHGTQEEWWEHFHCIEEGPFFPASEVHQRISQWLYNQKK